MAKALSHGTVRLRSQFAGATAWNRSGTSCSKSPFDPLGGQYGQSVNDIVGPSISELFCGVGIGHADGAHPGTLGRDNARQAIFNHKAVTRVKV